MREIKFRAWCRDGDWDDNEEKREFVMIDGDSLSTSQTYMLLKDSLKDIEDEIYFMQYTGLKDKNGKDIYEGDILRGKYSGSSMEPYINVVKWEENGCSFSFANAPMWTWEELEVIGNIYENPTLLTQAA